MALAAPNEQTWIAGSNERAAIKCYLINGVCHQAANRILVAAGFTVRGARGYGISEALFTPIGRVLFAPCRSPFNRHAGASGDVPECAEAARSMRVSEAQPLADSAEWAYIAGVLAIHQRAESIRLTARISLSSLTRRPLTAAIAETEELYIEMFSYMCATRLGPDVEPALMRRLIQIRRAAERERRDPERAYAARASNGVELAERIDSVTMTFQESMANTLSADQYRMLFDLPRGEFVVLADPEIVRTSLRS